MQAVPVLVVVVVSSCSSSTSSSSSSSSSSGSRSTSTTTSSSSSSSMLRTNHFNIVLKLLNTVGNFSDIIHLFDRMTSADELLEHRYTFEDDVDDDQVVTMISGDDGSGQFPSRTKVLTSKKTVVVSPYKPGTFTIAEFIRSARRYNSSILAVKAMTWGIENSVYIPLAVISDCIFLLYR